MANTRLATYVSHFVRSHTFMFLKTFLFFSAPNLGIFFWTPCTQRIFAADSGMNWLWTARALWVVGSAACLLASDLPGVRVDALRRIAHYGKLRSEVAGFGTAGPFPRLQERLAQLSLAPRAVWTAYYMMGGTLNIAGLLWEVWLSHVHIPCAMHALDAIAPDFALASLRRRESDSASRACMRNARVFDDSSVLALLATVTHSAPMQPCAMLALLQLHLVRRIYESVYVTRFSMTRREHPLTVCVGAFFYVLLGPSFALEVHSARLRSGNARHFPLPHPVLLKRSLVLPPCHQVLHEAHACGVRAAAARIQSTTNSARQR